MNKKLAVLFFLQLKSVVLLLPKLLFVLIVSVLFCSGIYTAGNNLLSQGDRIKLPVALVLPENDTYAGVAFSFLEHMDSIKSTCSFERTTEDNALSMLEAGEVYAAILIPDSFIEHILNGTNTPATLVLPREGSVESILFLTLADAGVSTLATAQAGIYAMDEVLISCGKLDDIARAEEALNELYLSYALNRDRLFDTEKLSATGTLSLKEHFICSGIVLFLLLSGMGSYDYFREESAGLRMILRRQKLSSALLFVIKLMAITLVYTAVLFPLGVITGLIPFSGFASFFLLILATQAYLYLFSLFCSQQGSYIVGSAILSVLFLFLAGGFVPSVFLPTAVRNLGTMLPGGLFFYLARSMFI